MDVREQCYERATRFAIEYGVTDVSEHIMEIMVSIMCTRDKSSHAGGGFVQAVVDNNLYLALSRADKDCRANIYLLAMCNVNCFIDKI
jgi:alcohol dehydrogenase YqhD (iron-dependent ADH family)